MAELPARLLFACTMNSVRSPMAAAIMKRLFGHQVHVDSAGLHRGPLNGFAVQVMDEIGIDLSGHRAKTFEDLGGSAFDVVISLSAQAQHRAVELTRAMACEIEFWNTFDPTAVEGNRETVLAAYREVRDGLFRRVEARFDPGAAPVV